MEFWDKSRQICNCRLFNPDELIVVIRLAAKAEVDEMWSFVGKKHEPRGRWHVIDHRSGHVLAHVFGRRKDTGVSQAQSSTGTVWHHTLLYAGSWDAYTRHRDADEHQPGKRNTKQIEWKPLTWHTRITRLVRETLCFAKSIPMHDMVIGVSGNWYALNASRSHRRT